MYTFIVRMCVCVDNLSLKCMIGQARVYISI